MTQVRKMPSKQQIFNYWNDKLDDICIEQCFACSSLDTVILDRAHILAKAHGGNDSVENLHLLCKNCHANSEYFADQQYWQWFKATSDNWFSITLERVTPKIIALKGLTDFKSLAKMHGLTKSTHNE